ncbi:MAG: signal recognition particle-docking protein FtsY [Deltaproteobacteria bacterium]|nr:signal recognition particle-docking protein FtsY [Deltaproteobacteria bacterium]
MGRWFRRKDEDWKKSRAESEAALEENLAEAGSIPEQDEVAEGPSAEDLTREAPGELQEAPQEEPSEEAHRGFFARFRKPRRAAAEFPESEPIEETTPPAPVEASCAEALVLQKAAQDTEPELAGEEVGAGLKPAPTAPVEVPEEPGAEEEAVEPRKGMFTRLRERLSRTRETLAGGLDRLFNGRKEVDALLLEELEELLITADIGVETTLFLIQALHEKLRRRELSDVERLKAALKSEMAALLTAPPPPEITSRPWVVLVVGINGVGKTTTIAKLAHQARLRGLKPMLVAADTFRAAAVEQLEIWGERVGAPVIKQKTGADPAAVVFDGLAAAQARGVDLVFIDTAGRLHTKVNLMEELKKIHRTAVKKLAGAPHEVYLVLDATTGQNALSQARLFHEAVGLTGLILTKMDGTAKGGVALGVVHETGIPLRYIGVGEGMEDLRPFDAEAFVEAILG